MVELTLFIIGATPVGVGGGIVCLKVNRPGEVGYGAVEIKCLEMRGPASEVWGGITGIGFNCIAVIRDRAVNLLLLDPIPPGLRPGPPRCQRKRETPYHSDVTLSADLRHPCALIRTVGNRRPASDLENVHNETS